MPGRLSSPIVVFLYAAGCAASGFITAAACTPKCPPIRATAEPISSQAATSDPAPDASVVPATPPPTMASGAPAEAPAAATPAAAPSASPAPTPAPPPPDTPTLPEVTVTNIGLHVGGGPNTPAGKKPFQDAVERSFDDLRSCYRVVEQPKKGGIVGVDLRIPREGGRAKVQGMRTIMRGDEFRACIRKAFANVDFDRPKKGPTVISYSVRFALKEGTTD